MQAFSATWWNKYYFQGIFKSLCVVRALSGELGSWAAFLPSNSGSGTTCTGAAWQSVLTRVCCLADSAKP